jgi:hypothetical protein
VETVCHKHIIFEGLFSKEVVADFEGGRIISDTGGLLQRELDQRYRLTDKAARICMIPVIPARSNTTSWLWCGSASSPLPRL